MAKHITGLTGADEGDRLQPTFLHFSSDQIQQQRLIQQHTINYTVFILMSEPDGEI